MNRKEPTVIDDIIDDKAFRIDYFGGDFGAFFDYHYGWTDKAPYEDDWDSDIMSGKNIIWEAFRASRKTSRIRAYVVWAAIYKIHKYIVVQSYESSMSAEWVRQVGKMLFEPTILEDYGYIFPTNVSREELSKASFSDFDTTTGVKIESKSLGEVLRGANVYQKSAGSIRPDLLILDDIDTTDSVKNPRIIDDNIKKLNGETISAMDPVNRRIIFLGNTIANDGILPRFKKMHGGKDDWRIRHQPLFTPDGTNIWPEVFTPEVVKNLQNEGEIAFRQNYLLIPYQSGNTIIKQTSLRFADDYPYNSAIVIGVDPAFSLNTESDSFAITVTGHFGDERYVIASYELTGDEKNEENIIPFIESLYHKYEASIINIEGNNGGEIISRMISKRNLAVQVIKAIKDKVTRLREHEGRFTRGEVFFLPGTEKLQEQLIAFPGSKKDDMVDSMVHSFLEFEQYFISSI